MPKQRISPFSKQSLPLAKTLPFEKKYLIPTLIAKSKLEELKPPLYEGVKGGGGGLTYEIFKLKKD